MKVLSIFLVVFVLSLVSCKEPEVRVLRHNLMDIVDHNPKGLVSDSIDMKTTYLSVYSQIFHRTEKRNYNLAVNVSIRNTSATDTLYLFSADLYDTEGKKIREYVKSPVYLIPLETVAIFKDAPDEAGGSGANFLFDWYIKNNSSKPLFEAVMLSTSGQQGISFTTQGILISE